MKTTAHELLRLGLWDKYCEQTGTNVWAVNEGLLDGDEEIEWEMKDERCFEIREVAK